MVGLRIQGSIWDARFGARVRVRGEVSGWVERGSFASEAFRWTWGNALSSRRFNGKL